MKTGKCYRLTDSTWGLLFWFKDINRKPVTLRNVHELYQVGRGDACNIQIAEGDSIVKCENMSRIHFVIRRTKNCEDYLENTIEDYSANGTFVNGKKLSKGRNVKLVNGDVIAITCRKGNVFTFVDTNSINNSFPNKLNQQYLSIKNLGKGSFGEVWLCINRNSLKKCAIKSVPSDLNEDLRKRAEKQLRNESNLLCSIEHPCIVKYEEEILCKNNKQSRHIVMEYMQGGSLQQLINNKIPMEESLSKYYFLQIVCGVKYLHDNGIVHRDLKPENLLLSSTKENAVVKISDFGLSKIHDERNKLLTFCGTPLYMAPEIGQKIARSMKPYTKAVDIWSLGVIIFRLLSGHHPFPQMCYSSRFVKEGDVPVVQSIWSKLSDECLRLVLQMLKTLPTQRPTSENVLQDQWMKDDVVIRKFNTFVITDPNIDKLPFFGDTVVSSDIGSQPKRKRV